MGIIEPRPPTPNAPDHCSYCNAKLNPFYYFCVACGQPYKPVRSVVSAEVPELLTDGQKVTRFAPNVTGMFWAYFTAVLVGGLCVSLLFGEEHPLAALLVHTGVMALLTFWYGAHHWKTLSPSLANFGFNNRWAWIGLLALIPALAINFGYTHFLRRLLDQENVETFGQFDDTQITRITLFFVFCFFPAVVEEIAFRGLLQTWTMRAISPAKAIVFASFLFTVLHFNVLSFPYLFGLGCLLGFVQWKTSSTYPSILIHLLHNWAVISYAM